MELLQSGVEMPVISCDAVGYGWIDDQIGKNWIVERAKGKRERRRTRDPEKSAKAAANDGCQRQRRGAKPLRTERLGLVVQVVVGGT